MYYRKLLVESLEQGNVDLEILVVVTYIYKRPKELMREDQLEGLSVLLHRVQEPQQPQAKDLHFVLRLNVVSLVLTL